MSLRELAEADLSGILEDATGGFGWLISVTDPDNIGADLIGYSNDIGQMISPDSGMVIAGRSASVALRISTLANHGMGIPQGVADATRLPWLVTFADILGRSHTFKVREAMPDLALGVVTCTLEAWE